MSARAKNVQTDLSTIGCPASVSRAIDGDRTQWIFQHGIEVDLNWWNNRLSELGLPGGPLQGTRDAGFVTEGRAVIERRDLFKMAEDACASPDGALALLWHALAWGSGNRLRNNNRRLQAIATDVGLAGSCLQLAAQCSRDNARDAFLVVCPRPGHNLVKWLGPAFTTKFLYFSGAGQPNHPCLILDARVARSLHHVVGWKSLRFSNWPADTYVRYCDLLHRWSSDSSRGDAICADEIERSLFHLAGTSRARR